MMLQRHSPKIEVVVQEAGLSVQHLPLRPIKHCVPLHMVNGVARSSVQHLPPLLHGLYYSQAQQLPHNPNSRNLVVKPHQPATLYVLWPVLQVRWSFGFKQRVYLNLGNLRKAYEQQPMLVWRLRKTLKPGAEILLPAAPPPDINSSLPWFDYVLCVRPITGTAGLVGARSTAAALVDKLLCNMGVDPATCPLQDIYAALEEGTYDPTALSAAGAEELLKRVMLAVDYDLLTLLVKNGIGECCTQPCLQLLLEYAQLEGLPRFAELVVQQTKVELTTQLLRWLVQELLTSGAAAGLEQLLVFYCMERRNPLSAVAAIERVLVKVAATGSVQQQEAAMALSARFHGAKHALLQQLLYRHAVDATTPQGAQDNQNGSRSNRATKEEILMPQKPLLELLHLCFDEKSGKVIGRGSHAGSSSIHDSSPYAAAVRLADTDFLSLPPVVEYTDWLSQGTELHTMRGLLLPDNSDLNISTTSRLRKLRAAIVPVRAAVVFKLQAEPADVQGYCSPAPGSDLAAASSLYVSTSALAGERGLKSNRSTRSADGASCYPGMPEATMLPAAASSLYVSKSVLVGDLGLKSKACIRIADGASSFPGMPEATTLPGALGSVTAAASVDNEQPSQQQGIPGPCAEAMEGPDVRPGHMSDYARNSRQDIGHQQSTLSSVSDADCDSRPPIAGRSATISSARWLDPCVGLDLLRNMGLAGDGSQPLARVASTAMHTALLAPRALHNSPRCRWFELCFLELLFLVWYQVSLMGLMPPVAVVLVLPAVVVGNLVDAVFQLHYKYKGSFAVYLSDAFVQLSLVVNLGLLAVIIWLTIYIASPSPYTSDALVIHLPGQQQISIFAIVGSAFAVFVWVRALAVVIPLSARLGAMLVTVRRACEEVAALVPLILVLVIGFATSLAVVYQHVDMPEYSTMFGAMRMLVSATGGSMNLLWFDQAGGGSEFLTVWGQVIMTCYVIVVDILIMTLLIAVINYSYHPVIISQQTVVNNAQTVQHYTWQTRHGIAGSPTNVLQLLLLWLSHGSRTRIPPTTCLKWWVPPLDGYVPANAAEAPELLLATGPAEASYLAFLVTMYPILAAAAVGGLLLHTPLAVLHFAVKGHTMWLDSSSGAINDDEETLASNTTINPITQNRRSSLGGAADMAAWSPASRRHSGTAAQHTEAPAHARKKSVLLVKRASLVLGRDAAPYLTTAAISRRWPHSSSGGGSGIVPVHHSRAGWRWLYDNFLVRALQAVWFVAEEPLTTCWHVVLAAVLGFLVQLLLVVMLAIILAWAWVTRVLFSVYCMLMPSASNLSCSLHLVRHASFWSKADIEAAFAAADNVTSQLQAAAAAEHNSNGLYKRQPTGYHSNLVFARSNSGAEAASGQVLKHAASNGATQLDTQNSAIGKVLIGQSESSGPNNYLSTPRLGRASAAMLGDISSECQTQQAAVPSGIVSDESGLGLPKAGRDWCGTDAATAAAGSPAATDDAGELVEGVGNGGSFAHEQQATVREPAIATNDSDQMMVALSALSHGMSNDEVDRQKADAAQPQPRGRLPGIKTGVKIDRRVPTPAVQKKHGRSAAALSPYAE